MTDEPLPYEKVRNANLPWGYWLLAEEGKPGVVDEAGRRWDSIRRCFWMSRLNMAPGSHVQFENQCEFLLAALAVIGRRMVFTEEQAIDLFSGNWERAVHYTLWLEGHGLVEYGFRGQLTPEGQAVLVMLASTRAATSAPLAIGLPTLAPRRGLDRGETRAERASVLAANEAFAAKLPDRFRCEDIGGQPSIKLVVLPEGENIPMARVLWTMSFLDDHARDRFYFWLIHRIDRWLDWAEIARRHGAQALSEHLLQLAHADRPAHETG